MVVRERREGEGWGGRLNERQGGRSSCCWQAQHAGVAILSEKTRVMMEIVTDGHDGVLIDKRERREEEEHEGNMADWKSGLMKMTSLQDNEGNSMCLLRRLSSAQPGIVLARQVKYFS